MPTHQPTVINNEYTYFTWQHTAGKRYQIINTTLPALGIRLLANVVRIDENGEQVIVSNAIIPATRPNNTYDVDLTYKPDTDFAGDGVYRYCVTPIRTIYNQSNATIIGGRVGRTITTFPVVAPTDTIQQVRVGSIILYDSTIDGPADFSNPPTSLANVTNGILNYLNTFVNLPGSYNVRWVAPNVPNGYIDDSPVPSVWRLVVEATTPGIDIYATTALLGMQATFNTTTTIASVHRCVLFIPDVEAPTGYEYISSFVINGTNVVTSPIHISTPDLLFAAITAHLQTLGTVTYYPQSNINNQPAWIVNPCATIDSIRFAQIEEEELPTECYLQLDLLDTYTCFAARLRNKLCKDPCCTTCDNKEDLENEKIIDEISLLLDGAILRMNELVQLHQWQGYVWITEENVTHTTRIVNYFTYLRKLVFNCGYGCKEVQPCGC